jgi:hypothetical protein
MSLLSSTVVTTLKDIFGYGKGEVGGGGAVGQQFEDLIDGIAEVEVGADSLGTFAEGDLSPGIAVVYVFDSPDAVTGNIDKVLDKKTRILDVEVIAAGTNGANANTYQVDNGTDGDHITDAISLNGKSAGGVVRAATIDPSHWDVDAGDTLRIIRTKAGGVASAKVVIRGVLV